MNSFVDRDMLMRYLDGGVGHYQHHTKPAEDPNVRLGTMNCAIGPLFVAYC
jgi:hypothetical protein